jgi:hypothetical protein
MAQKQKIHAKGTSEVRYFWSVGCRGEQTGEYRSRHSNKNAVIAEFARNGKTVMTIRPVLA